MDFHPVTLDGDFARLEPLTPDHAAGLAAVATPDIFKYHFPPREFTEAGFKELIGFVNALPNWLVFAIVQRDGDVPIGTTAYLDIDPRNRGVEIGFTWIATTHQGTAINPEIKYMMLKHAFEDQQVLRVQLKTDSRNLHSQRAIEKLGAVREGTLRKHMVMFDGFVRDTVFYSITDDEWPRIKQRLEERLATFTPDRNQHT